MAWGEWAYPVCFYIIWRLQRKYHYKTTSMLVLLPAPRGVGAASVGANAVPVAVVAVVAVTSSVAARLVIVIAVIAVVIVGPLLGFCALSLVRVACCCVMCAAGCPGACVVASIASARFLRALLDRHEVGAAVALLL